MDKDQSPNIRHTSIILFCLNKD